MSESMGFTFEAVSRDALTAVFGSVPRRPTYSVLIEHVEWVSAEPRRPMPRSGWRRYWDRATGRHRHALRLHATRRAAWVEAGCPKVPTTVRTYIPHAVITEAP